MKIRVFPCDLDGSGCYRILYPYGFLDSTGAASVSMDVLKGEDGRILLPIPPALIGYGEAAPGEVEEFLSDDIYVFQRPLEKIYPGLIAKLKFYGKKVVVEVDDFMHGLAAPTPREGMKLLRHRVDSRVLSLCMGMADLVTVSTYELQRQYVKFNPNIIIRPNYVRHKDFEAMPVSWQRSRPQNRIHVGWMGLMDFRANDLSLIKPWLQRFLRQHPQVTFVNVGSQAALDYLCVPKDRRIHLMYRPFPEHLLPTSEIDIGLVPLTNNTFNECKSHLKGMEYGAVGAAVVASPTQEYRQWVDGTNGRLVEQRDWADHLHDLVTDDTWRGLAEQNQRKALENTIETHYKEWLEPLCSLLSSPSPATV